MQDRPIRKTSRRDDNSDQGGGDNGNFVHDDDQPTEEAKNDDELEFVVTEKNEDDREFVGGQKRFPSDNNELGVEQTSELMEREALSAQDTVGRPQVRKGMFRPIGETAPPLPEQPTDAGGSGESAAEAVEPPAPGKSTTGLQESTSKLPASTVTSPKPSPTTTGPYLTDREKEELIEKMNKLEGPVGESSATTPAGAHPGSDSKEPRADLSKPKMAKRGRGLAYYYKNYIQLKGNQPLHADDELYINNRCYELKPKQLNAKVIIATGGVLFALALFLIGSQFVSSTRTGQGEIVGMVLDETGQPNVGGATIKFPGLGKTIRTTPQGFFRSGPIPKGTHKIEYMVDADILKVDYATVAGGKITMLSLRPEEASVDQAGLSQVRSESPPLAELDSRPEAPSSKKTATQKASRETTEKPARRSDSKSGKKSPAKITLAANVEEARLVMDGNVLGAGNLTYSKIKPGKHEYEVSKDGFQTASGTIQLSSGESKTLTVELVPMNESAKAAVFSEEDYYYSGTAALEENNLERAISDLSEAISRRPSYAQAYLARAEAYTITKEKKKAYDDHVRAAEIFRVKNDLNKAVTAYNSAIKLDKESVTAHLGRANVYLAKNEEIAAIADYETVLRVDKRNAQAHYGLGEARFRQGRYKKACEHFKDARSIDSQNPLTYQYLMLCYLAMDDIKRVKKSFEKFQGVASQEQMKRLRADSRFGPVLRIVERN